jgi:cytochrome bd-type quinol oxidase subunit 2
MLEQSFLTRIGAPGALISIIGGSFLVLGLLIMIFPELLAWLVGGFLIFDGIILLSLGLKTRRFENRYEQQRGENFWSNFDSF